MSCCEDTTKIARKKLFKPAFFSSNLSTIINIFVVFLLRCDWKVFLM
jgi:hypothetical protein